MPACEKREEIVGVQKKVIKMPAVSENGQEMVMRTSVEVASRILYE